MDDKRKAELRALEKAASAPPWCAVARFKDDLKAAEKECDELRAEKYRLLLLVDTYAESHRAARAETEQEDSDE